MEFKQVTKKNGDRLVFCNFEELLMEAYGVKTMKAVKPHEQSDGGHIIHCPFCKKEGHTKHKLYIKEDMTVGYCFVCCRSYINVTDEIDVSYKIPAFSKFGLPPEELKLVKLEDPIWSLDKYYYEFEDYDETGIKYLKSRHEFMVDLYKLLDFKFMDGNIVMPFKYKGEVFYYQIRFSGNSKIRYFFPPIKAKPPYIIEHGDNKKLIICEGIYDAIALLIQAPSYTPVAVLGSSISDYQIEFLREYLPDEILIYMDETRISIGIAEKLKSVIDYCPIRIIKSDGQDPEECLKRKIKYGQNLQWIK